MTVTNDKYELPLFIADSPQKLAEKYGVTPITVISSISRYERGKTVWSKYRRVRVDEDEETCTTKEKISST